LVTVPLYISHIGASRYGVVAISWMLLGYFGFLDFGLSRASANALSRLGQASNAERSPVLMTAFHLNLGLGVSGGIILYAIGSLFFEYIFKIPSQLQSEALAAFPWMAAMLPLGMVGGVATGVIESRERFLLSSMLSGIGSVVGQVFPLLCAIFISPSLSILIPATLSARLLTVLFAYGVVVRLESPIHFFNAKWTWVRKLFGYGAWVSVSSLVSPLLETLDQLLIGSVLGTSAVTHYVVPMNLSMRSQIIASALARTLFPRLSRMSLHEARALNELGVVSLAYGFGAICGPAILLSNWFLQIWISVDFAVVAAPVAQLLLFGAWFNGIAFIPYALLQGQGRPDLTAKIHLAEIIPFIGALFLLMHFGGLPGAALAWTLRVGIDCIVLLSLTGCLGTIIIRALPAVALMAACLLIAAITNLPPFLSAMVAGVSFAVTGLTFDRKLRIGGLRAILRIPAHEPP
jgi:O-antigen/teichoic acid export membrane protein